MTESSPNQSYIIIGYNRFYVFSLVYFIKHPLKFKRIVR